MADDQHTATQLGLLLGRAESMGIDCGNVRDLSALERAIYDREGELMALRHEVQRARAGIRDEFLKRARLR